MAHPDLSGHKICITPVKRGKLHKNNGPNCFRSCFLFCLGNARASVKSSGAIFKGKVANVINGLELRGFLISIFGADCGGVRCKLFWKFAFFICFIT